MLYEYVVSWGNQGSYDVNDYEESVVYSNKRFTQAEFEQRIEAVFVKWEQEKNWTIGDRETSSTEVVVSDLVAFDSDFFIFEAENVANVNLSTWKEHV